MPSQWSVPPIFYVLTSVSTEDQIIHNSPSTFSFFSTWLPLGILGLFAVFRSYSCFQTQLRSCICTLNNDGYRPSCAGIQSNACCGKLMYDSRYFKPFCFQYIEVVTDQLEKWQWEAKMISYPQWLIKRKHLKQNYRKLANGKSKCICPRWKGLPELQNDIGHFDILHMGRNNYRLNKLQKLHLCFNLPIYSYHFCSCFRFRQHFVSTYNFLGRTFL